MTNEWSQNLIFLREKKGETQLETATALHLSRSTYANYEANINLPSLETIKRMLSHFKVTFEELMVSNISIVRNNDSNTDNLKKDKVGEDVRKHVRNRTKKDPETWHAFLQADFYLKSMGRVHDVDNTDIKLIKLFITNPQKFEEMASLLLPDLGEGFHIRIEVPDNNMESIIKAGDKVVATHIKDTTSLCEGDIYIVIDEGNVVRCNRLYYAENNMLLFHSDNETWVDFKRNLNELIGVFKVVEVHTRHLGNPAPPEPAK